jgi:hypothetical protein
MALPKITETSLSDAAADFLVDGDETLFQMLARIVEKERNERAQRALFSVMVSNNAADVSFQRLARFCRETRFFQGTAAISAERLLFVLQEMAQRFPLAVALLDMWPHNSWDGRTPENTSPRHIDFSSLYKMREQDRTDEDPSPRPEGTLCKDSPKDLEETKEADA